MRYTLPKPMIFGRDEMHDVLRMYLGESIIMRRNAIPHIFCNRETGEYLVVQPDSGTCHPTNPLLHDHDGMWHGVVYDKTSEAKARTAGAKTGALVTSLAQIEKARLTLLEGDWIGYYAGSISRTQAWKFSPEMHEAFILQPGWGTGAKQKVDAARQFLVRVCDVVDKEGQKHPIADVYANDDVDFGLWHDERDKLRRPVRVESFREITAHALRAAFVDPKLVTEVGSSGR